MLQLAALISIVVGITGFASTPRDAALQFLARKGGTITHVDQTGRFAVATFSNSQIESQREGGQLLLRRYGFGWQATDGTFGAAFAPCRLVNAGVPSSAIYALSWRGSLTLEPRSDCREKRVDLGSASDVNAVRAQMAQTHGNFLIGPVRVSHNYAIADWTIPGGGEVLLKRTGTSWKQIAGGGGALSPNLLTAGFHVPEADAKMLIPQGPQ